MEGIVPVDEIAEEDDTLTPALPVAVTPGDRVTEGVPVPKL